jgi:DNA-binding Xre family transcriptional regulator
MFTAPWYNQIMQQPENNGNGEVKIMRISYKKLWKLLIDLEMNKLDLSRKAHVSAASVTKLAKNQNVNVDILVRICSALKCELWDIMDLLPDKQDDWQEK